MDIIPFKGYRYNPSVVGDPGLCIAPPYDVIDPEEQKMLHQRSEYNIVRITKGLAQPGDDETRNVYTRAADVLQDFIAGEVLKQDAEESIYVYAQDFASRGRHYRRSGFVALGRLETYGGRVKPHEHTLAAPKTDRLKLMRATRSQAGQIFVLYNDQAGTIDKILDKACEEKLLLSHTDNNQVMHCLHAITDPGEIANIAQVMADKDVFIADGHHRYETALDYYNESKNPAAAYRMMTFINTHNEGLIVLPTHRLIKNIAHFDCSKLLGQLNAQFDVGRLLFGDVVEKGRKKQMMLDALALELQTGQHAFGMYFGEAAFYVATLRDISSMDAVAGDHSPAWRQLDVAVLHKLILEKLLGVDTAALEAQTNVEYIKDFGQATDRAIDRVDCREAQGLFFMNPTPPGSVEAVARAGEKMPQKSTFFYPKIFSGLVLNLLS